MLKPHKAGQGNDFGFHRWLWLNGTAIPSSLGNWSLFVTNKGVFAAALWVDVCDVTHRSRHWLVLQASAYLGETPNARRGFAAAAV